MTIHLRQVLQDCWSELNKDGKRKIVMSSVKKNFGWNLLLTVSGYIFPILTFPYVTRVLGAEKLGIANFAMSFVDYIILFSTLGLGYIGCREISQNTGSREKLDEVFSKLVTLHLCLSLTILLIYLPCIFLIPEFATHRQLYFVGIVKILTNILLVEWLFNGLQKFKFITTRSLIVKLLYVCGIFVFVRKPDDYDAYFYLAVAQVTLNGVVNWYYSRRYVTFSFRLRSCGTYFLPVLSMGVNLLLFSFYGTFNVLYLGMATNAEAVGYYTTSVKLYSILLAVISAFNGVLVPYLNNLYGKGDLVGFKQVVEKTFPIVFITAMPIMVIGIVFAREIIFLIAGDGFERAVYPFQIILIQVLLVGIAQILENQILLAFKKYREILITTILSVSLAIIIIILFVPSYAEVASAYSVAIPHVLEAFLLYYFAKKCLDFEFSFGTLAKVTISCVPMTVLCICCRYLISDGTIALFTGGILSMIYYLLIQYYIIKNEYIMSVIGRILDRIG